MKVKETRSLKSKSCVGKIVALSLGCMLVLTGCEKDRIGKHLDKYINVDYSIIDSKEIDGLKGVTVKLDNKYNTTFECGEGKLDLNIFDNSLNIDQIRVVSNLDERLAEDILNSVKDSEVEGVNIERFLSTLNINIESYNDLDKATEVFVDIMNNNYLPLKDGSTDQIIVSIRAEDKYVYTDKLSTDKDKEKLDFNLVRNDVERNYLQLVKDGIITDELVNNSNLLENIEITKLYSCVIIDRDNGRISVFDNTSDYIARNNGDDYDIFFCISDGKSVDLGALELRELLDELGIKYDIDEKCNLSWEIDGKIYKALVDKDRSNYYIEELDMQIPILYMTFEDNMVNTRLTFSQLEKMFNIDISIDEESRCIEIHK